MKLNKMNIIQTASKLRYKHYTEFTVEELDKLPLSNQNKQIEYYFIQKWLREIHKIHINVWFKGDIIYDYNSLDWCYEIKSLKENFSIIENRTNFKSFEQALEKSLYQALLLI